MMTMEEFINLTKHCSKDVEKTYKDYIVLHKQTYEVLLKRNAILTRIQTEIENG